MEAFGFKDYKEPIGDQMDMRTSTYLGHKYINDGSIGYNIHSKVKEIFRYSPDPVLETARISDYKDNYVWKFDDPANLRNPSIGSKVLYIKPFDDMKLKFIKRDILPPVSVSRTDYARRPKVPEPPLPHHRMCSEIKTTPIVIDRSKIGFSKELDPAATTYRLAFVQRTPEELMRSSAAKDHITVWNWDLFHNENKSVFERSERMCDKMPSLQCPTHRGVHSSVKHVPHTGLTTENRTNYLAPHIQEVEDKSPLRKNVLQATEIVPFTKKTEYNIYGSGDPTHRYIGK